MSPRHKKSHLTASGKSVAEQLLESRFSNGLTSGRFFLSCSWKSYFKTANIPFGASEQFPSATSPRALYSGASLRCLNFSLQLCRHLPPLLSFYPVLAGIWPRASQPAFQCWEEERTDHQFSMVFSAGDPSQINQSIFKALGQRALLCGQWEGLTFCAAKANPQRMPQHRQCFCWQLEPIWCKIIGLVSLDEYAETVISPTILWYRHTFTTEPCEYMRDFLGETGLETSSSWHSNQVQIVLLTAVFKASGYPSYMVEIVTHQGHNTFVTCDTLQILVASHQRGSPCLHGVGPLRITPVSHCAAGEGLG